MQTTRQLAERLWDHRYSIDAIEKLLLEHLVNLSGECYPCLNDPRRQVFEEAQRNNNYWLPCIICGTYTGGNESVTHKHCGVRLKPQSYIGICADPKCLAEADRINNLYPEGIME